MRRRSGFTLIEFLIALVIIGFIVALLVTLFASPVRQAKRDADVQQVIDQLNTLSNAITSHLANADLPDYPIGDGGMTSDNWQAFLRLDITSYPRPPESGKMRTTDAAGLANLYQYRYNLQYWDTGIGTGAADSVLALMGVSQELCEDYNTRMGSVHAGVSPPPPLTHVGAQCGRLNGPFLDNKPTYYIIKPVVAF